MASLITCLAKALRRYDTGAMLVLADLCEERELHESARILRLDDSGPRGALYEAYVELHKVRNSVRKAHPMLRVYKNNSRLQKRFVGWIRHLAVRSYGILGQAPNAALALAANSLYGKRDPNPGITPLPPYRSGPLQRGDERLQRGDEAFAYWRCPKCGTAHIGECDNVHHISEHAFRRNSRGEYVMPGSEDDK